MRNIFLWAGLLVLAIGGAQAEDRYRWVDPSGKVHYSDRLEVDAQQVEQKKIRVSPADENADLPYEMRRAQQNFPVTLYTADNCKEACSQARDLLNKRGIPFTEKNLVTQEEIDKFKQSGMEGIPTLAVGKNNLSGFLAEKWNSELNVAGYPKTAPYRPKISGKPSTGKPAAK